MTWELREVGNIECTLDDSGVYTIINRVETPYTVKGKDTGQVTVQVRLDLMHLKGLSYGDEPIMSWVGTANNVRKAVIEFLRPAHYVISLEHASYIGYELLRAEVGPNYVQD